jgi:hypothetical protein
MSLQVAYPDAIFTPSGRVDVENDNGLDPCPFCNSVPEDAPESVHSIHSARKNGSEAGKAVWNHPHCWKCGYRPGTNMATSEAQLRREFAAWKEWQNRQSEETQRPALTQAQADDLKAQLEAANQREAELRSRLEGTNE